MFVLECLEFVTLSRCIGCPAGELGLFMLGPGKSNSSAVIYFTDKVLNLFSVPMFAFKHSQLSMPSWHGFSLSEQLEYGLLKGHEDAWITVPSGCSFNLMFIFKHSQRTMPSWHGFALSEQWEHSLSRGHGHSLISAPSGCSFDLTSVFKHSQITVLS